MSFAIMEEGVVIVGAGIGGLATAVALKRVGVSAVVLERAAELRAAGAALGLFPNAWLALDALGVAHKLAPLYAPVDSAYVTDVKANSTRKVSYDPNKRGGPRLVHRKILLQTLADELPPDVIRFSSKLTCIKSLIEDGHRISVLELEDGTVIKAKVVIGCDGIHSVIARKLKLGQLVHSGRYTVRGLSVYPEGHGLGRSPHQFLGETGRAGIGPINDKELYWFFLRDRPTEEHIESDPELTKREIIEVWAKNFPEAYIDVVRHSDLSTMTWAPLMFRYPWDVILGNLNTENMTVVGDAMHPMTPDLAQGGCMALEDAVVLGRHLGKAVGHDGKLRPEDIAQALKNYTGERRWRATWIIAASYLSGWIQQGGSGWWMKLLRIFFYAVLYTKIVSIAKYDCGRLPTKR